MGKFSVRFSKLFAVLFAIVLCSVAPVLTQSNDTAALSTWTWSPSKFQLCNTSLSSGLQTQCIRIPSFYAGVGGATIANNAFISGQNYTNSSIPWQTLRINLDTGTIAASTTIPDISTSASTVLTSFSTILRQAIVASSYIYSVNDTGYTKLFGASNGYVGSFDESLQQFWSISPGNLYYANILKKQYSFTSNSWNMVAIAVSQKSGQLYGVAVAATATILYSYDTFLSSYQFIGSIAGVTPLPFMPAILDESEQYFTFMGRSETSSAAQIITIKITPTDFKVVSMVVSPDASLQLLQQLYA